MIIRNAQLADKTWLMAEALRLARQYHPELRPDVAKMNDTLRAAIAAGPHYAKVAMQHGKVVGALIGLTHDGVWAQRRCCQVVLWYSLVPGAGARLLRDFVTWLPEQRAIRVAGFYQDMDWDERVNAVLYRIGFERRGGVWLKFN
jgi:hypothetical protein